MYSASSSSPGASSSLLSAPSSSQATKDAASYDEESALVGTATAGTELDTFDVPSTDIKRFRKFSALCIGIATLVLCFVAFYPESSHGVTGLTSTRLTSEVVEVGRLKDGKPQVATVGDNKGYPEGFQLFLGERPIPHADLPREGESFKAYDASIPKPKEEKIESPTSGAADPVNQALSANPGSAIKDPKKVSLESKEPNSWENTKMLEAIKDEQEKLRKEEKISASAADAAIKEADSSLLLCTAEISRKNEMYTAPKGCALISDVDMTFHEAKSHSPANVLVICAPANIGTFPLDAETLESFGMIKDNTSVISSVLAGEDTSVGVYSGGSFDGNNYVVNHVDKVGDDSSLLNAHFAGSPLVPNDNIKSLIFQTTASSTPRTCKSVKSDIGFKEI